MSLKLYILSLLLTLHYTKSQSVVNDVKLDNKEVRCLVCEASIKELTEVVSKTDNSRTVKIGGHRLDPQGNYDAPKTVPLGKSEIHISELMEKVCEKMDDYVRGLHKSNGTLTLFKMIGPNGQMNPLINDIEFVQDDDLNKSLKYYCESIVEEFEENIIKYYQKGEDNIETKFCIEDSHICPPKASQLPEKEL
ncbi:protein seele [Anthonomus grandis grandis]|uniref:protein seele n=1 Tax=Anthonomus grandis grandis TaxID=2921223 RepID=UPI0021660B67|nr:protein seele [Anthonomus grandis grandis]